MVSWTIAIVGYLLAFWVIIRIVLQRKEPTATLAWMLGVVLVPYAGVLAYLLFGRRRLRRQLRLRRARANAIEPHLAQLGEGIEDLTAGGGARPHLAKPDDREMIRLANRIGSRLPTCGNAVELYVDASHSYDMLEEAIRGAKTNINCEYYIWKPDRTGRRFRDALADKAREGVVVRVMTDGFGSRGIEDFMAPLVRAGGFFAEFSPLTPFQRRPHRANLRNHRKIAVIDGKLGFTGGVNIGDEYTGRKAHVGPWRDTHLRVEGPAVYHLQEVFAEDWHFATGEDPTDDSWFPAQEAVGQLMVQLVASGPDRAHEPIQRIFFAAITGAKERVLLTTPYFVPDQAMLFALQTAALRGVSVQLLLPRQSDMRLALHAGRSYYDELLNSGVRIFEYLEGVLHAKTLVVDATWATVGSANMDVRSFRLNFEVNLAMYGKHFAEQLAEVFSQDLRRAAEITQETLALRTLKRRTLESFARTLSPLL